MYFWGREVGPAESVPVLPVPALKRHPLSIPLFSAQVSIGVSKILSKVMGPQQWADGHQSRAADVSRGQDLGKQITSTGKRLGALMEISTRGRSTRAKTTASALFPTTPPSDRVWQIIDVQ